MTAIGQSEIRNLLIRIRALLERHEEKQWSKEIAYLQEFYHRAYESGSDFRKREALERIKHLFRGMGSFNDFRLSKAAGHDISTMEQPSANRELDQLTTELYRAVDKEGKKLSSTK